MLSNQVTVTDCLFLERRRREKQQLANEIFGKNRRHSGAAAVNRKPNHGPSLASRVGISKVRKRNFGRMCKSNTHPYNSALPVQQYRLGLRRLQRNTHGPHD
jgi:hypothetical protein